MRRTQSYCDEHATLKSMSCANAWHTMLVTKAATTGRKPVVLTIQTRCAGEERWVLVGREREEEEQVRRSQQRRFGELLCLVWGAGRLWLHSQTLRSIVRLRAERRASMRPHETEARISDI